METISSLAELGMDHGFINNWSVMNSFDELSRITSMDSIYDYENLNSILGHKHYMEFSHGEEANTNRPMKQQKSSSWSSYSSSSSVDQISTNNKPQVHAAAVTSPNFHVVDSAVNNRVPLVKPKEETAPSFTLNFGTPSAGIMEYSQLGLYDDQGQSFVLKASQGAKRVTSNPRSVIQAQDHILAERKRREKLSQRFIAMSTLLPGLNKRDKASILGDAIKHIKHLQERVATLEEAGSKKSIEMAAVVRKNRISEDGISHFTSDGNGNGNGNGNSSDDDPYDVPIPLIEAKILKNDVLIRFQCEKIKSIHETAIAEVEKLSLSVMNSSALTFGDSTLDITILAKMGNDFNMPVKDLVLHLHLALKEFI